MPTTNGTYEVEYQIHDGYREDWQEGSNEATMIVSCDWDLRKEFVWDMVGYQVSLGGHPQRFTPEEHPDPDIEDMWCDRMNLIKGVGFLSNVDGDVDSNVDGFIRYVKGSQLDDEAFNQGGRAWFQATFCMYDWNASGHDEYQDWTQKFIKDAAQNQPIPLGTLAWANDRSPIFQAPTQIDYMQELHYVRKRVPAVANTLQLPSGLRTSIRNCVGHVNYGQFDIYPQGTLLCQVPDTSKRYRDAAGDLVFDIHYVFLYRGQKENGQTRTWNQLYRVGAADYQDVVRVNTNGAQSIFPFAIFDFLWQ